jgi:hypothetical protein
LLVDLISRGLLSLAQLSNCSVNDIELLGQKADFLLEFPN